MSNLKFPIVVIGAGAGGLSVATGAARHKKRVLLIEENLFGGTSTNWGCLPSKTLIASSNVAHALHKAQQFGLTLESTAFHADGALARVKKIVKERVSQENPEVLEKLGVQTLKGHASFIDERTLEVIDSSNEKIIVKAKNIVIATGSSPFIPSIPGLDQVHFHTNTTIFSIDHIPKSLVILGAGPIGCELGQAFQRLGTQVSIIEVHEALLPKEEPEAQKVLSEVFQNEGIRLFLGYETIEISHKDGIIELKIKSIQSGDYYTLETTDILLALGRQPNVTGLNLEAAGVDYSEHSIKINNQGRTNKKKIWAIGDVTGPPYFEHYTEHQARTVLANLLIPFPMRRKIMNENIPHSIFTDPEVARIGPSEAELKEQNDPSALVTYFVPFTQVDRAIMMEETEGFVKITTKKLSSKILGATVVGSRGGEMLCQIETAMLSLVPLSHLTKIIYPYPTFSLAIRKAADLWHTQTYIPFLERFEKSTLKGFIPLIILLCLMLGVYATGTDQYFTYDTLKNNHHYLQEWVASHPFLSSFIFSMTYITIAALSLPITDFLTLTGGFLFPQPWSTLLSLFSATIGCTIIFLIVKLAFAKIVERRAGPKIQKLKKGFQENAVGLLLSMRFIPFFPFWLVNVAPAVCNVSLKVFMLTTFFGLIPVVYIFSQAGTGFGEILEKGESFSISNVLTHQMIIALTILGILALTPTLYNFISKMWTVKKNDKN